MACLLKPPQGNKKGCVTFTTQERDRVMRADATALAAVEALKDRFLIGLHHNWHDFDFVYDPLFDFSMAGDTDLVERTGRRFPRTDIDCCYFVPPQFFAPRQAEPFWDVINVTRESSLKGQGEFLQGIRDIYDQGRMIRVLHLCPVARAQQGDDPVPAIRHQHEAMFSVEERRLFTLMTMDWDHPRPLDMDTVAFFYRSARVFVHTALDERRCRIAAYSWANRMPVVGRENIGSLLPRDMRIEPFFFEYASGDQLARRILDALDSRSAVDWSTVTELFQPENAAAKLSEFLTRLAAARGEEISPLPINPSHLDFRMGRHHLPALDGPNVLAQSVAGFCEAVRTLPDAELAAAAAAEYPEEALFAAPKATRQAVQQASRQTARPAAAVPPHKPNLRQRLRTWLRKGHRIPFTDRHVVIDILRGQR